MGAQLWLYCGIFLPLSFAVADDQRSGDLPELRWESKATPTSGGYKLERKVINKTDRRLFVHWPLAGWEDTWIAPRGEHQTSMEPYAYPNPEDGPLEYTIQPKHTPTTVFRGKYEPRNAMALTIIKAETALSDSESKIVKIDLQIQSEWQASETEFAYRFQLTNRGHPIVVDWNPKSQKMESTDGEAAIFSEPLRLSSEPRVLQFRSASKPVAVERVIAIRANDGKPVFTTKALLFTSHPLR